MQQEKGWAASGTKSERDWLWPGGRNLEQLLNGAIEDQDKAKKTAGKKERDGRSD